MTRSPDSPTASIATLLWTILAIALASAITAIGMYAFHFSDSPFAKNAAEWGAFGDYVGGVLNPVFAFLALTALLATLFFQMIEFRHSTAQLRKSADALAKQNDAMALQNFERAFFEMVRLHNEIVSAIDLKTISKLTKSERTTEGRDCFKVFYNRFRKRAQRALRGDFHDTSYVDSMRICYDEFHELNEHNIGHYFRNLYRIFKFVEESDIPNKSRYTGLLRAQLSTFELALLFYNGLGSAGGKFPHLMVEFELLENFKVGHLLNWDEDKKIYNGKIFGDQRQMLGV